ncbi:MAG: hypothetical protein L0338_06215, partial [Acidobacteria bacterium]|nr:hypothetical protein [Acidobacteriota bacterium]
ITGRWAFLDRWVHEIPNSRRFSPERLFWKPLHKKWLDQHLKKYKDPNSTLGLRTLGSRDGVNEA